MSYFEVFVRRLVSSMCVIALCCSASSLAFAQASSASLSITVTDTSGAVIQDASATLRSSDTNQQQTAVSNKSGSANFPFLKPGHYALTVSKSGFSDVTIGAILLNVEDEKHLQLVLKVGAESQNITVDGSGATLNTADASVSTVIDRKFVENIPLNGRSFQDLISMTPGVVTQSPQDNTQTLGDSGDFSVNGQRTQSNYYTVDGVAANTSPGIGGGPSAAVTGNVSAGTTLGTTQSLISVDALQEFRVQSSTYSAEYGRSPGGQFSLVTRSGTNNLHGAIFDYLRNNFFDANDWFNDHYGRPISPLRQNDFGGTLGGPLWIPRLYDGRSRTFFFFSYEGLRLAQPQAATIQYVPDQNLRQIAAPVIQPVLNAYPIQNGPEAMVPCTSGATSAYPCPSGSPVGTEVPSGLAEFIQGYSLPSTIDSTSLRFDQSLSPRLSIFLRYGYTPSSRSTRTLSSLTKSSEVAQSYTLGATYQINASTTNDLRLNYSDNTLTAYTALDSFAGATPIDLNAASGIAENGETYFELNMSGVGASTITTATTRNGLHQWNLVDGVSLSRGHHQIKLGVDYRHIVSPLTPSPEFAEPIFRTAKQISGDTSLEIVVEKLLGQTPEVQENAAFIQDEWRVAPNFSISAGLRWELDPAPTAAQGSDPYVLLGDIGNPSTVTLAPEGTSFWNTTWYNLAPRLGAAWKAHGTPDHETVVRGGGGVFFDTDNEYGTQGFEGLGFTARKVNAGVPYPVTSAQLAALSPSTVIAPYTSAIIYTFPSRLQLPYTLQWNLSVQQAIGRSQSFTISYVGASGRRLVEAQQLSLSALNPNFNTVITFPSSGSSDYQGLQTQFQRSVTHGLQALASYTWSHSIDFGSNAILYKATRGNSDFDVRSNFVGGLSWEVPTSPLLRGFASRLLGSWGIDGRLLARTSFPVSLFGSYEVDPSSGIGYDSGLNLVPNQPVYLHGAAYPGGRVINPAAFNVPSTNISGSAPRNFVRGFGANQLNIAARKEFNVHDLMQIQFRAESFNLLNHPNFGYIDATYSDATFGQATKMLSQSLTTLAPQYQQGGPRSLQFALKCVF